VRKPISKITASATRADKTRNARADATSIRYEGMLIENLKDPAEAVAYLEAALKDGNQAVLTLALCQVAKA